MTKRKGLQDIESKTQGAMLPPIWLIILIAGLIQLSETIYSPSLPEIASALKVRVSLVEYTLTIFLFAFALGVLFWGKISDLLGRKPCVIAGLMVYIVGCIGCYFAQSIEVLMISRFVQAFGGSIGSVLMQAICRDAFQGPALGRAFSSVGTALGAFPAIGPIIGGGIAEYSLWSDVFLFLILFGVVICILAIFKLPETHHTAYRQNISMKQVALKLLSDKKVVCYSLLVSAGNGLTFSYYAEGSFYLIEMLHLLPVQYGLSYIPIAGGTVLGGLYSKWLNNRASHSSIMMFGTRIVFISCTLFAAIIGFSYFLPMAPFVLIICTIISFMIVSFGICIVSSNALAVALTDYKSCIGSASSIFGFAYYVVISLITLGMGTLHNGSLIIMPLYFLVIALFMLCVQSYLNKLENKNK